MTRHSPVKFVGVETPSTLQCPQCGCTNLILLGAKLYERSSDRLSIQSTEIGSGRPFVCEQAAGGSENPSRFGDAITIDLGCFFCTQKDPQNAPTLAVFENRGQVELAWIGSDGGNADATGKRKPV